MGPKLLVVVVVVRSLSRCSCQGSGGGAFLCCLCVRWLLCCVRPPARWRAGCLLDLAAQLSQPAASTVHRLAVWLLLVALAHMLAH